MKCDTYDFYPELIDKTRLQVLPPLKLGQTPPKEDLLYLYDELNLSSSEIGHFYGRSDSRIQQWSKLYGYVKPKEKILLSKQRRSLWLYGVKDPSQLQETRDKYRKTCLEKYGTDNIFSSEIGKEKIKQTNLRKYGVEHNHQCKEVVDKMKQTCIEKYGNECSLNNPEVRQKAVNKWKENWGTDHPWKCKEIRENIKQTCIEKYGDSIVSKTTYFKKLQQEHGHEWTAKAYETFKKNKTYRDSKQENQVFELLKQTFPDVIHHPVKNEKYPFICDFYIPSLDMYIEYQGHPCHGFQPFNTKSNSCLIQFSKWLNKAFFHKNPKARNTYKGWLEDWLLYDRLKRNTAKQNNLNYVELFSYKEAKEFINKIHPI